MSASIEIPNAVRICPVCEQLASGDECEMCTRTVEDAREEAADAVRKGFTDLMLDDSPGWKAGIGKLWRTTFEAEFRRLGGSQVKMRKLNCVGSRARMTGADKEVCFSRTGLRNFLWVALIGVASIALIVWGLLK